MRPGRAGIAALAVLGCVPLFGCNEGPAREALAEAEATLESVRPDLERHTPEALARLEGDLSAARQALAEGRDTDALRAAQELPDRIQKAEDRAATRRVVLESAWKELSRSVPSHLQRLRAGLHDVASGQTPSARGPRVVGARVHLGRLEARWGEASRAFEEGRLSRAVAEARAVATGLDELSENLSGARGVDSSAGRLLSFPHPTQ